MKKILNKIKAFIYTVADNHVSAYAAQSAFFLMLSLVPIILLLMTLIRYTPITQTDIIEAVNELFPKSIRATMVSIINEVYKQNVTAIPITALVTLWSAGRGVLAISNGLNTIRGTKETRNYIMLRVRAAFYTILFLLAIILSLVLLGFGNSIGMLLNKHAPVMRYVIAIVIRFRTIVMICILIAFAISIYVFLPNKKGKLIYQIPGAIFNALGWTLISFLISIYMDIFKGFSNIYGSLTTIVLIMLWIYFCMYIMLLGGIINSKLEEWLDKSKQNG